jgi:hypothetical protein
MSLLSTFISTQLIKAIEHEFMNHSQDIQKVIIEEVKNFLMEATQWVESKLDISISTESEVNKS